MKSDDEYQIIKTGDRPIKYQTDIFFWKNEGDKYTSNFEMIVQNGATPIPSKYIKKLDKIKMCGRMMYCPNNAKKFIEERFRYGKGAISTPRTTKAGKNLN